MYLKDGKKKPCINESTPRLMVTFPRRGVNAYKGNGKKSGCGNGDG